MGDNVTNLNLFGAFGKSSHFFTLDGLAAKGVVVDGEMIDGPFVLNARQILVRRDLIEKVEAERYGKARAAA